MKKGWKISLIVLASVLGAAIVTVGSYVGYVYFSYSRIGDCDLTVNNKASNDTATVDQTYSCSTYNIGFGAYSQDYTFFLDTGYDDDGNETCGHYSTARSEDAVNFNVNGAIDTIKGLDVDFAFFQEVDTDSTRSYHVDENKMITDSFSSYSNVYCSNFHSAFLAYPFYDMHGKSNAGITTLSKFAIQESKRKEYTISTSLSKFFDLDRCFSVSTVKTSNDKTLYLVNNHMSAYDKGGVVRTKQMQELYTFVSACYNNGDYVIVGGDYNHDLLTNNPDYTYNADTNRAFGMTKKAPDWISYFFDNEGKSAFDEGFSVVASDNYPTCRNNDIEWEEGKTFTVAVDGFIVSDNITVVSHSNIQTQNGDKGTNGFAFADHDPAYMEFKLNS